MIFQILLKNLQSAEIAPAGLHFAGVAVLDELGQHLLRVFLPAGVLIVLDAVHFDALVVLRKSFEMLPGWFVGLDGVQNPVFENK